MEVVFLLLVLLTHVTSYGPPTAQVGNYCRTLTRCDEQGERNSINSNSSGLGEAGLLKKSVIVSAIVPLTGCTGDGTCGVVDFRTLDVIGLEAAIKTQKVSSNFCVEIELCDSNYSPITASRIIGSYNLRESCGVSCPDDEVCFTECGSGRECKQHVAIIGPGTPRESKALADITSALRLPQLLYSTGSAFSEPSRYQYLHQLAPDYSLQVDKIVQIIRERGWRYIAILATEDTYGILGYELLKKKFENQEDEGVDKNFCVQLSVRMLPFNMDITAIEAQLGTLVERTKVVILWMEGRYADSILNYFQLKKEEGRRKDTVFIASDGWSINTQLLRKYNEMLNDRFIGVFPDYGPDSDDVISSGQLYKEACRESGVLNHTKCAVAEQLIEQSHVLGYAGGVVASLRAIYKALNSSAIGSSYEVLRSHINSELRTRSRGEGVGVKEGSGVKVYTLLEGRLIPANDNSLYPSVASTCSERCKDNEYRILDKKSPRCCYQCKECSENSIVNRSQEQESCTVCHDCFKPDTKRSMCVPKLVEQFSIVKGDSFSVAVYVISIIGIFCNIFVMVSLIKNSNTPIVKASSPQLCYIMLVSLMLLLTAPILMVSGPNDTTCPLQRYIIGIGTVIPIAVLFARTNRINVIFNRRSLLTSHVQKMVMSVKYNVLLIGIFAFIQFSICLALHVHHEQMLHSNEDLLDETSKIHVKTMCSHEVQQPNFMMCNEHRMDLVYVWIGYVCAIILATTVVAYKTRRLPENFNEARFICMVMFVIIVLTISTVSTYMVLDSKTNIMYQCWSIIVAVYSILGIIYGHKMYVIYVIPEENRRSDTHVALKKFIKQDSDKQAAGSSRTYSQLLIPRPRVQSDTSSPTKPLLSSPSATKPLLSSPNKPLLGRAGKAVSLDAENSHSVASCCQGDVSRCHGDDTQVAPQQTRKLSVAEKRELFRKGYVRVKQAPLVKAVSEGGV